ncbi:hypothetical protein IFR05_005741 [Cadophora sp. M221]|nr:hypothetical protein IFR05_005741 [Cadophora sp. M221]
MQKYRKLFEPETELIHRETLRRQHIETIKMLSRSGLDRNWLLIFDNVSSWKDIATYMPNNMNTRGSILITTQIPDLNQCTAIFTNIAVAPLSIVEATSLLMQLLGREETLLEDKAIAKKIAQALGGYPLSIATVGGYILQSNCRLREYFERFNKSSVLWKGESNTFTWQYEKTLQNVCDVALMELPATALELHEILAFLNPDEIPEGIC